METRDLIKMLLDEDAYVQDIAVEMNTDGFVFLSAKFVFVPNKVGIPKVVLMGKEQHDKIKDIIEPLEDELFEI